MGMGHEVPTQAEKLLVLDSCSEKERIFFKDLATGRYKVLNLYIIPFSIILLIKEVHENISHSFLRVLAI